MPHTISPLAAESLLVHPVVHPEVTGGPIGYATGDAIPSSVDDSSPHASRPHTPHAKLTQEEETRRNILSQVAHARDAQRAGVEDRSRSRSRARGSQPGSRATSLAPDGSRSGSRVRDFVVKVFSGSREGSREPSRERAPRGDVMGGGATGTHTPPQAVHVAPVEGEEQLKVAGVPVHSVQPTF